jgi:hypothetical protein
VRAMFYAQQLTSFEVVAAPTAAPADRGGLASGPNGDASLPSRGGDPYDGNVVSRFRRPKRPRQQEGRSR